MHCAVDTLPVTLPLRGTSTFVLNFNPQEYFVKTPLSRIEIYLLVALLAALLGATLTPAVQQVAHYHAFADQRGGWGMPNVMDVLSNMPFAIAGLWGLWTVRRTQPRVVPQELAHRPMAVLFFFGLLLTAVCSSLYHWCPDDAGLAIDRLGMVVAFAGLVGLALADRVSARAAWVGTGAMLLLGPVSVVVWASYGNLLPWVVLQGGGMLLVLVLAVRSPVSGGWSVALGAVIAVYAVAKALELGDHAVFAWTHGVVSGHSLKHAVAALAAWPVIRAVHNVPQTPRA